MVVKEVNLKHLPIIQDNLHLRPYAESLLERTTPFIKPEPLGVRDFEETLKPFPDQHQPVVILDLDDTVWPHVKHLVKAISKASNTPISMDYFRSIGHTRKIPTWQTPEITTLHNQILLNQHSDYLPSVNIANQDALNTITALKNLNCRLVYLTARPLEIYHLTLKTLFQNSLPYHFTPEPPDALNHSTPQPNHLYCSPFNLPSGTKYKQTVISRWLINLNQQDSTKPLIIIDDLLKPFKNFIDQQKVFGFSLKNDLNHHTEPYSNEIRLSSWPEINQHLLPILKKHQAVIGLD